MSTISCKEFANQLESWMEGERQPAAHAHLRSCNACQSLISDMEAIRSTARTWEAEESSEPPARIWPSLRLQLEAEGLIHDPASSHVAVAIPATESQSQGSVENRASWLDGIFAGMARPALAGSYLIALVAAGFAFSGLGSQRGSNDRWTNLTQNTTVPLRSQLDNVEHTVFSLSAADPVVTASLHKNLAIVDNYIVLCEKSVTEEPGNEVARDYLYSAYEQKADLLAQMTENGDGR
jgi:hypothetical protein